MRGLSILLLSLLPFAALADGPPRDPYIQVNGHGELRVAPDMVIVSLTLERTDADAKVARADVEARSAKVIALARKLGLPDKDIQAPAITVYPQYEWVQNSTGNGGRQVLKGQHVSRGVTLTLHDLTRYGDLVDGLFAAGVTTLGNVMFDRSDRKALEGEARALAVADAHDKAAGLAKNAGVTLGAVFSIVEQGGSTGPRPFAMAMAAKSADSAPEYLSGDIELDADVQMYYLIGK